MNNVQQRSSTINVALPERLLSVFTGSALVLYGLRNGGLKGTGMAALGTGLLTRGVTGHCQMYRTLGLSTVSEKERQVSSQALHVEKTMTVNAPAETVYRFWRDIENLPRFMPHLRSVQRLDDRRSHWIVNGPAGTTLEWDAEIITDIKNEHIAWKSTEHADVYNTGSVYFRQAPGGRGTEVKVVMSYSPPAGTIGSAIASLFRENPEQHIENDLRRFKSLMEAGEVATTKGQPTGSSSLLGKLDISDAIETSH